MVSPLSLLLSDRRAGALGLGLIVVLAGRSGSSGVYLNGVQVKASS
jgi:hypothetical protein